MLLRFAPTADNGPLHAGHMLCLFANVLLAKRHGGKLFIRIDSDGHDDIQEKRNKDTLRMLLPGVRFERMVVDTMDSRTSDFFAKGFGFRVSRVPFWMQAVESDFRLGVTDIVRGREWRDGNLAEPGMCHYLALSSLTDVHVHYHPMLCRSGSKLAKSSKSAPVMVSSSVDGLGWLTYVASLFAGRNLSSREALASHTSFGIRDSSDIEHDPEVLREAQEDSRGGEGSYREYVSDIVDGKTEGVWW